MQGKRLNLAGRMARYFIDSRLTVLIMAGTVLFGLFALIATPREENPQITVPAANVFVQYPGASAEEVEEHIAKPLEAKLWEIPGVEDVYSIARDSLAIVTVKFYVGQDKEASLVKLYDKLMSNMDIKPAGALDPVVKPIDVDDVPVVAVTLYSDALAPRELRKTGEDVLDILRRIPGTANPQVIGGQRRQVDVALDPERIAAYRLSATQIARMIQSSNANLPVGSFDQNTIKYQVETGDFLRTAEEVGDVVVASSGRRAIHLRDIADVADGMEKVVHATRIGFGPAGGAANGEERIAVTVALAKKRGLNAVKIADQILARLETLKGNVIPPSVKVAVTRNDGEKADHAVNELVFHLVVSIVIVVALLAFALGKREALIVAIAIPLTLFFTLGVGMLLGQTINRITLFALILSLGLLVDDAIVVVENIHRHFAHGARDRFASAVAAVHEIGSPTVLATLTVIVAFIPMGFVTGMMGPYMRPIPVNVPVAMLASLLVAFIVTPWAAARFLTQAHQVQTPLYETMLYRRYRATVLPFLRDGRKRKILYASVASVLVLALLFPVFQLVKFRMLPKANKNTFLVTVDMPSGTVLARTDELMKEVGAVLHAVPEVRDYETFAGVNSVMDFNGLLRGGSFRNQEDLADIRVNLLPKEERDRSSEEIVDSLRPQLHKLAAKYGANLKLVEDPPGPPVRSTVVAEIYGPTYEGQRQLAGEVRKVFGQTKGVTDIDDSVTSAVNKYYFRVYKEKALLSGVSTAEIVDNLYMGIEGKTVSTLHVTDSKLPVGINLRFGEESRKGPEDLARLYASGENGGVVPLSELVDIQPGTLAKPIYHRNLEPVVYVYGEMEGRGVTYAVVDMLRHFWKNPLPEGYRIKWDGEWKLQWDVMYDLGMAMLVAVVFIYLILVGRFGSFSIPLVIMGAIPLAMIGIMPGFALTGVYLSATSMIGIIALSGIVVRNSIVLLEFLLDKEKEMPIE
ncbi:MAG: efflux RND transporter permease subunit, partial [Nitrospinae bacterium]|nr:efflux RND transporter permease subunit [Nitrospinota bacterium]